MSTKLIIKKNEIEIKFEIIDLKFEYENYSGTEKYAIVTDLTNEEIQQKYSDDLNVYAPYILLTLKQGEAITEYQNYEAKERMRNLRFGNAFDIDDGEFEEHHPEVAVNEDFLEQIILKDNIRTLHKSILNLPEVQRQRIISYFFKGKSYVEIANEEDIVPNSVRASVLVAIKNLKKVFDNDLVFPFPSSYK